MKRLFPFISEALLAFFCCFVGVFFENVETIYTEELEQEWRVGRERPGSLGKAVLMT